MNPTLHEQQARHTIRRVYYTGNGALDQGIGLCYDRDYTSAADLATESHGLRDKRVELPSAGNANWFAGVTARSIKAVTGGQWVEIYEPGSVCEIALCDDTVNGTTLYAASVTAADQGRFSRAGFPGRGCALALQTVTAAQAKSLTGGGSISGSTLTHTNNFDNVLAGDVVVILGGGVAADGTVGPVAGRYTVSSVTANDALVLASAPGDGVVSYYVIRGNPMALAYLLDGKESGLQEWLNPINNTAVSPMNKGITHIGGGGLTFANDSTGTLADADRFGELKGFRAWGAITTQDWLLTVTSGLKLDGSALSTIEFDAAGESATLMFGIHQWRIIDLKTATQA